MGLICLCKNRIISFKYICINKFGVLVLWKHKCLDFVLTQAKTLTGHVSLTPLLCLYTLHAHTRTHTQRCFNGPMRQCASHYATNVHLTVCVVRWFWFRFYTGRGRQGSSSFFRFMPIRTKFEELMGFRVQLKIFFCLIYCCNLLLLFLHTRSTLCKSFLDR